MIWGLSAQHGCASQVRAEGVQAVEVLWTPQEDGDTLTQDDITRDYPTLKTL